MAVSLEVEQNGLLSFLVLIGRGDLGATIKGLMPL